MKPFPLEHITHVAPLGLGFWDVVTGSFVAEGLQVTAIPQSTPVYRGKPSVAVPNHSGVFVFHHLPGLIVAEGGAGDKDYWENLPEARDFIVTVTDSLQRFLPFKITVKAPKRCEASWGGAASNTVPKINESLLPGTGIFSLFSSPARSVPYGLAGIRATIKMGDAPAPWAVVEAYSQKEHGDPDDTMLVARGIADKRGQIVLIFPYPKFIVPADGEKNPPLTAQRWFISLKVFFAPGLLYPEIPHLSGVAMQEEKIIDNLDPFGVDLPTDKAALRYGVELILKTRTESTLQIKQP